MKQYVLMLLCVVSFSSSLFAQNATDFTTDDCNGISHSLFDSLDAGNVIVIAWVMPCGGCIDYAQYAYDAVQSFSGSDPERVDFYLVDDYANTSCANLVNWGNSHNMPLHTAFSSGVISMSDYGTAGMPKVVVLSGSEHSVYYNKNDDQIDFNGVHSAIDDALSAPLNINEQQASDFWISIFPSPTNDVLNIKYESNNSNIIRFEIVNILGEAVLFFNDAESSSLAIYKRQIDVRGLEKGIYFLNVDYGEVIESIPFIVCGYN